MIISRKWQTWLFAAIAMFAIAMTKIFQPDLILQLVVLVPAVALLGLPHGALDLSIAQKLWPLIGWKGKVHFSLAYVSITILIIAFWMILPAPALFIFLIYSSYHFSSDWDDAGWFLQYIGGVTSIGAPALFWRDDVATIFAYLAPVSAANLAALSLSIAGAIGMLLFLVHLVLRPKIGIQAIIEQIIIWIAAACLSPLVYFVIYFCGLHSVRHFTDTLDGLGHRGHALRIAGLLSLVTILVGYISFVFLQRFSTSLIEQSIVQIVFIGVAALTVPHMLLVDRFQKQKRFR